MKELDGGHLAKQTSGKYIRRWRHNLKLTYEQVAEELGVHPVTVRNWEKQKSLKRYVKLAFDKAFMDKFRVGPEYYKEPRDEGPQEQPVPGVGSEGNEAKKVSIRMYPPFDTAPRH